MKYEITYDGFLSHASEDTLQARLIRGYMRSHNIHTWFDHYEIRICEPLDDPHIEKKIKKAIDDSRYFIVIMSEASFKSEWVKREVEYALQRKHDGHEIYLQGILIEEIPENQIPTWFRGIRVLPIAGEALSQIDRLRELRQEIGAEKPTYIDAVEPNFFKQITIGKLTEHLEKCPGDKLDFWHINGGYSARTYLYPAIRTKLQDNPNEKIHCRILLVDSVLLGGSPLAEEWSHEMQERFDDRISFSAFFRTLGAHHELVNDTIDIFNKLQQQYPNITCEFKLTSKLPAARLIIFGDVGFFSPFIHDYDANLPVLVYDRNSPFFTTASNYFESAYNEARKYV